MSCSQFDAKAYFFGELAEADRRPAEDHLKACQDCREELERLRITRAALVSVPEEELPRRIAFVSDRVFEPRGWRRWLESAPKLGFASAAMLSAAILVHAFIRPAPVVTPPLVDTAAIETRIETEVARRLEAVVQNAMTEAQDRQAQNAAALVKAAEERLNQQRQADLVFVGENFEYLRKKLGVYYTARNDLGGAR